MNVSSLMGKLSARVCRILKNRKGSIIENWRRGGRNEKSVKYDARKTCNNNNNNRTDTPIHITHTYIIICILYMYFVYCWTKIVLQMKLAVVLKIPAKAFIKMFLCYTCIQPLFETFILRLSSFLYVISQVNGFR